MTTTINASPTNGIVQTADGSGVMKLQSNGVTTNALAWVNFNGTTSPGTIRSQYNVGSVTKNGTGDYTVNFTTTLSDANYSSICTSGGVNTGYLLGIYSSAATPTTSSIRVGNFRPGVGLGDESYCCVAIFGN